MTKESLIYDFGCGNGRHIRSLFNQGYKNIQGYEFINEFVELNSDEIPIDFGDCRTLNLDLKADNILCLYDVIGSFADDSENQKIISAIYHNLKVGGQAVISVLNLDYIIEDTPRVSAEDEEMLIDKILKLSASSTMQSSGEIFDSKYLLLDENSGVVYRKEIFSGEGLNAEYIIRDKRYTLNEISELFSNVGFRVKTAKYVSVGKWSDDVILTSKEGKEILLFVEK